MKRLLPVLTIMILLLMSCPMDSSFSDLEGYNLLSSAEQAFTGWTIDYGKTVAFNYMTFAPSAYPGPGTGDTVYRTEIVNLMPNGDFRAALSAAWTDVNGPTYGIVGEKLDYFLPDSSYRINFNLADVADGILDNCVSDAGYFIRFQLKSNVTGASYFEYANPVTTWSPDISNTAVTYEFPEDFISYVDSSFTANGTNVFTIGTIGAGGNMNGTIDDLRITRTDISNCIILDVPVISAGRPDLESGTYRFTLYVKNDPDVTPVTDNRMPARALSMAVVSPSNASVSNFSAATYDATAAWAGWTAYSVTGFIQVDNSLTTALQLRFSPNDQLSGAKGRDVGSFLVSAPFLEFSSTGSF